MRLEKIQDAIKALYKVALHLVPRNCQETQRRTGSGDMRIGHAAFATARAAYAARLRQRDTLLALIAAA